MNFRKIRRNLRKDMRGISPVIATLLMIAIAVVASLVVYAWTMGYMNFQQNKTGQAIQIQSISISESKIYVQNVGTGTVTFSAPCVYIDGAAATLGQYSSSINEGSTGSFAFTGTPFTTGQHTVKVVATGGTFSQITQAFP
jgi:archaeal type IV pilus assembly protein PilA